MPYVTTAEGLVFHYRIPSCQEIEPRLDPSKPTVLMLHPRIFDLRVLQPQFDSERLSRGYNLLAVDHSWHGLTKVPMDDKIYDYWLVAKQLLSVLDALKVSTCHIFGVQIGSILGLHMAILDRNRVLSLTLCSCPPPKESPHNIEQYSAMRDVCREPADDGSDSVPSVIIRSGKWIYFGNDKHGYLFAKWLPQTNFKYSNQAYLDKFFSSLTNRNVLSQSDWASIRCPVLMIHGDDDTVYPTENANATFDMLKNVTSKKLHFIKGGPMFLPYTHPNEVNALTADFLDSLRGQGK